MQQASCLEGGPLLWIWPLYLHVNQKSDDDDDDDDDIGKFRCVCFVCFFSREKWSIKYGSYCIVATAQMKFASEARPSQYIGPFGNTEPTCMPLSGHFMDIEGRVLVYQTERYQLSPTYNASW